MDSSVYKRPNKPNQMLVQRRKDAPTVKPVEIKKPLIVDSATECHITPADVANRMAIYLLDNVNFWNEQEPGNLKFLEPSAGTGMLIDALLEYNIPPENITAVERHITLANNLHDKYSAVNLRGIFNDCFLEYAIGTPFKYDFILINPPFRKVKQHMKAAVNLLDECGALVALVPITYQHDRAETLEELPNDTFSTCKVNTKIILIEGAS